MRVKKKWKKLLAMALVVLMINSVMDYSGFLSVSAENLSDTEIQNDTYTQDDTNSVSGDEKTEPEESTVEEPEAQDNGTEETTEEVIEESVAGAEGDEASVTDSEGGVITYSKVEDAITAAMGKDGSIVTLMKDVATENRIQISTGNFSIDLKGKTWIGPEIWEVNEDTNCAIEITDTPTLVLKDTVGGGVFTSANPYKYVILNFSSIADISLEGGTYSGISNSKSIGSLLAEGCGYQNSDGTWVTDMSSNEISDVTVAKAPIELYYASVTEADSTVHNYLTIEKAITAATGMDGSTVTLLKDVTTASSVVTQNCTLTIDLNGKTWNANRVTIGSGSNVTIEDSLSGGKITSTSSLAVYVVSGASLTLKGGTYSGGTTASIYRFSGTIEDLLAEGYGYKNSDGTWVTDMSGNKISNVTVRAIPVKITEQPEDTVATPSYTEAPIFTVTAETVPTDSGKAISYQWYRVGTGSGGADEAVSEKTEAGSSYTVSTGLAEGTYTYYCTVTCDGYMVNTENATLFVTSAAGNYEVTASSGSTVSYPTLETAITAAKSKPNSTVKLLADATTASQVVVSSGTFTIDLNGKTWTSTASAAALELTNGSHVTLKDSATDGKMTTSTAYSTIYVQDADVTIKSGIYENESSNSMSNVLSSFSSGMVTIQGGTIQTSKNLMYLVYFQSVDVAISGGTFSNGSISFDNCDSVGLTGGKYRYISTNNKGIVADLLASGYGYKNVSNNTWVNDLAHTFYNMLSQWKDCRWS